LTSEKWLVDPGELAERLAGIAHVYLLEDKWAGYTLTEEVGKQYSCYNGAVRLYWPDFSLTESPYSPVYVPETVRLLGPRLINTIFGQLAAISAFRFLPGPVAVDALEFLHDEAKREMDAMKEAARNSNDYGQLLDLSEVEMKQLRGNLERLTKENDDLKAGLQLSQENLKTMWQAQEQNGETATEVLPAAEDPDVETVRQAVEIAQSKFRAALSLQHSAFESAGDSPFKQPKKVLQALEAMYEVCLGWRRSRQTKSVEGPWEQQFSKRGLIYKAKESVTSKGKWGEEYEMLYGGKKVSIEQHLALGNGGPDTCLRIHFYADADSGKFVVAHVGRHKTNTST